VVTSSQEPTTGISYTTSVDTNVGAAEVVVTSPRGTSVQTFWSDYTYTTALPTIVYLSPST
jgi:hypothetical protein